MISTQQERLERIFGKGNVKQTKTLPDKVIIVSREGAEELCHHTGFKILDSKTDVPSNWWNVYVDVSGRYHLDR